MSVFDVLVRRPVAMSMVVLATIVFGVVSYQRLPLTLMPDLSYPTLTVRTDVPGTATGHEGSPAAAATPTQMPVPFGETRAMPLTSPAGFVPVTWKPKKMLPWASAVSGVLMKTLPSNAAGLALYCAAP